MHGLDLYIGDVHDLVAPHWAGMIVTIAAVVCGGFIGLERARAHKPAGARTLILICLGSAIFTQASILVGGGVETADRSRIAAQIVSGIGFLGAGAIIRERGFLIGLTTGAGIWATAAVGLIIGAGYVAAGVFFSLLIVGTLSAAKGIDRILQGPPKYSTLRLSYAPGNGKTALRIQSILDENQYIGEIAFEEQGDGEHSVVLTYRDSGREDRSFIPELIAIDAITRVSRC